MSGSRQGAGSRPGAASRSGAAPRHGSASRSGNGSIPQRRCAVYTRKSSEEGLEQEYNSLHAQREACEAYVRSQQHEGWRLLPAAYDDGGLSGGSMDRPALQRLLADIRAGLVDTVVVYKVDRLTRSLADFARMVDVFDAHHASFVAVTQQFNTTTSMGRLTLNILLSFAQFEREVTGERIRDKIAASKRRGMWMGGRTPLGYRVEGGKLLVVPEDAATVVGLYRRYLELGSVRELKAALDADGVVSKPCSFSNGTQSGGVPYSRGALYALLGNPTYLGQVRHKDAVYPGQHRAIVPAELYAAVQARLAEGNNGGPARRRARLEPSPLAGKLFDQRGERLVASHARKGERRYRYYVSASLLRPVVAPAGSSAAGTDADGTMQASSPREGWRLPAREIEQAVWTAASGILQQPAALVPDMLQAGVAPERIPGIIQRLTATVSPQVNQAVLQAMVSRVELASDGMLLSIDTGITIDTRITIDAERGLGPTQSSGSDDEPAQTDQHITPETEQDVEATLVFTRFVSHRVHRRGKEMRLVIEGAGMPARDDAALLKVVARAHCWFEAITEGQVASVHELAERLGITSRYVQRVLPLALLAPALVERIAAGLHQTALTVDRLTDHGPLPIRWTEQLQQLEG